MNVDDFVGSKVQPEHQGIVAMLRQLMREMAPSAEEVITRGIIRQAVADEE